MHLRTSSTKIAYGTTTPVGLKTGNFPSVSGEKGNKVLKKKTEAVFYGKETEMEYLKWKRKRKRRSCF
jgi:ethanolamine utilization protein EutP (predicted NTPase)